MRLTISTPQSLYVTSPYDTYGTATQLHNHQLTSTAHNESPATIVHQNGPLQSRHPGFLGSHQTPNSVDLLSNNLSTNLTMNSTQPGHSVQSVLTHIGHPVYHVNSHSYQGHQNYHQSLYSAAGVQAQSSTQTQVQNVFPAQNAEYVSISPVNNSHTHSNTNTLQSLNSLIQAGPNLATNSNNHARQNIQCVTNGAINNSWPCPSCEIPFSTAHELQQHLSTHTKLERTLPCSRCGKLFATHERLKIHVRNSHSDKSHHGTHGPFYVRAHFSFNSSSENGPEISFTKGDIFHVVDTFQAQSQISHNHTISASSSEASPHKGSRKHISDTNNNNHQQPVANNERLQCWLAIRVGLHGEELDKGLIPNEARARHLAAAQAGENFAGNNQDKLKNSNYRSSECSGANFSDASSSMSGSTASGTTSGNFSSISSSGVISSGGVNFFKKHLTRRCKSLGRDQWESIIFENNGPSNIKLMRERDLSVKIYERVILKHPGFIRPVVIYGPLADIARNKLLRDYPEKYSYPIDTYSQRCWSNRAQINSDLPYYAGRYQNGNNYYDINDLNQLTISDQNTMMTIASTSSSSSASNDDMIRQKKVVIKLTSIHEIIQLGKHALLDIMPTEVEKLNNAHLYPIVIFMKADSKSIVKEFRSRAARTLDATMTMNRGYDDEIMEQKRKRPSSDSNKSCRQLLEQARKLEKQWSHLFTSTLNLSTMGSEMWYKKLREIIEDQQSSNIWMGERQKIEKKSEKTSLEQHHNSNHQHYHANHQLQGQQQVMQLMREQPQSFYGTINSMAPSEAASNDTSIFAYNNQLNQSVTLS